MKRIRLSIALSLFLALAVAGAAGLLASPRAHALSCNVWSTFHQESVSGSNGAIHETLTVQLRALYTSAGDFCQQVRAVSIITVTGSSYSGTLVAQLRDSGGTTIASNSGSVGAGSGVSSSITAGPVSSSSAGFSGHGKFTATFSGGITLEKFTLRCSPDSGSCF